MNDFISHDWASGRWQKTIALLFVYNSRAAFVASSVAAVLLMVLQLDGVALLAKLEPMPRIRHGVTFHFRVGIWSARVCPVVFLATMLYWQQVRRALRLWTRMAFVDKFCIDQADGGRKRAGILGLAAFLASSDRLVICWTPRYFTRLWCTYEVAAWLHLRKELDSIVFVPLSQTLAYTIAWLALFLNAALYTFAKFAFPVFFAFRVSHIVIILLDLAIIGPPIVHLLRQAAGHVQLLQEQIRNFSIHKAGCFCCSNDHKLPGNGGPISCDRKLICETVQTWFGQGSGGSLDVGHRKGSGGASDFDATVQKIMGPILLQKGDLTHTPYLHALYFSSPLLWTAADVLAAWGSGPPHVILLLVAESVAMGFFVCPVSWKFMTSVLGVLERRNARDKSMRTSIATTLLVFASYALCLSLLFFPLTTFGTRFAGPGPSVAWHCLLAGVTLAVYRPCTWRSGVGVPEVAMAI